MGGKSMTDEEVLDLLRGDSALNRARQALSGEIGRIYQEFAQRGSPLPPIGIRREEFETVLRLAPFFAEVERERAAAVKKTEAIILAEWDAHGDWHS
jgi:hypothetical protein